MAQRRVAIVHRELQQPEPFQDHAAAILFPRGLQRSSPAARSAENHSCAPFR